MIEGLTDEDRHSQAWASLEKCGVSVDDRDALVDMLKAVFLLGDSTDEAASLLGVPAEALATALKERTVTVRRETTIVRRTPAEAIEARDALAKELYARCFDWVVQLTNEATPPKTYEASCGLLDIFGFESFPINRFEQLCINYANERLQEKFCRIYSEASRRSMKRKACPGRPLTSRTRRRRSNCMEGPMGVVDVLDEERARPARARRFEVLRCLRHRVHLEFHESGFFVEFRCSAQVARSWLVSKLKDLARGQL